MLLAPLDLRGVPTRDFAAALPRPDVPGADVAAAVAAILAEVRVGGDDAVRACTLRFDQVTLDDFRVPDDRVAAAPGAIESELAAALASAWDRILDYHRFQADEPMPGDYRS